MQSGSNSVVCAWTQDAARFTFRTTSLSWATMDLASALGFSSTGDCGLTADLLSSGAYNSSPAAWFFDSGRRVQGWYQPSWGRSVTFSSNHTGETTRWWAHGWTAAGTLAEGVPITR